MQNEIVQNAKTKTLLQRTNQVNPLFPPNTIAPQNLIPSDNFNKGLMCIKSLTSIKSVKNNFTYLTQLVIDRIFGNFESLKLTQRQNDRNNQT